MRCRPSMRMALLAVVALAGTVRADRAAAERAAAEAERTQDPAAFVACGQAFLDAYNQDPTAATNDEVLFDAGRCFEAGKSISAALQAHALVIKSFPTSKLAAKSLALSGRMYAQIAMYDRAAERFERYATRYAGEKDARDMLGEAIRLRAALGDSAKQIADTNLWIRMYGAKTKQEAARAAYSLVAVYDGDGAIAQLRAYLKDYGAEDPDLTIAAHTGLGDRLRARSCPVHAIDGLCVKAVVDRGPRCGTDPTSIVAVARTSANHEALAEYREAVALADVAKGPVGRHAQAMARLALADDELEAMIANPMPRGLPYSRAFQQRFARWREANRKLTDQLDRAYGEVLAQKDATSAVAAAARFGEVSLVMWRGVMASEVPADLPGPSARETYCGELKEAAEPFRARAIEAVQTCIAKAGELQAGHDWAEVCWREGAALDPAQFPPVRELRAAPGEVALPIALEPAVSVQIVPPASH